MIPFYALKSSENLAKSRHPALKFCLASCHYEELNKMQTTTHSAHPAQNIPTQNKSSGLLFLSLFSLALWLAYAVKQGLIIESVIYALSYFYDDFHVKIHVSNIYPDLFLLSVILLALYGLHTLIKNYFAVTVAAVIIAIMAGLFLMPDTAKRHADNHHNELNKLAIPSLDTVRGG
jgi:hypothetical protein